MGNKRAVLGKAKITSGGSDIYGLWVSKPGVDVINTSNSVLCDSADMLFNSNSPEIAGNVLASGSTTITFNSNSATTANSADVYYIGDASSNTTFDYVPLMLFCRVSGDEVFPLNTSHGFYNTHEHGDPLEPRMSSVNGNQYDVYAKIYKNKFVLHAKRWVRQGILSVLIDGLANGTHTFHWAALAVGETEEE